MLKHYQRFFYCFLMTAASLTAFADNDYVATDRYTMAKVGARSDQKAPLTTVVTLSFGVEIKTVGQAIQELLQGSGYHWVIEPNEHADHRLNELPLPAIVRTLGPIRLDDALETIAGESWGLVVDEVNRTLWFDIVKNPFTHQLRLQ